MKVRLSTIQLDQVLKETGKGSGSLFSLTFPIDPFRRQALYRILTNSLRKWDSSLCATLWCVPGELPEATIGSVARLTARGVRKFCSLEKQANALWNGLVCSGWEAEPVPPRLWGGVSFADDFSALKAKDWSDFSPAEFVLPRWRFTGEDLCTVYALGDELRVSSLRTQLARQTVDLLECLQGDQSCQLDGINEAQPESDWPACKYLIKSIPEKNEWAQLLARAQEAFASGALEKVVLARKIVLQPPVPVNWTAIWNRLQKSAGKEIRFAFRRAGSVFLGASPERLVARTGPRVIADALAGSQIASERASKYLLTSEKDLREHQFVVREIAARLALLGGAVEPVPWPSVRELRHVLHLHTPICSTFVNPPHVLRLVENLHPTPAVGGTPTKKATEFLATYESFDRGWYAAPVGWFAENGDGDFAVALRSGLFQERKIQLYAGAGLVRGSDIHSEWEETEWKLQAMREAMS